MSSICVGICDMFLGLRTGTGLGAHNSTGQSHMKSHRFHSVLIPFCNAFSGPNPHRLMWTIKRHLYIKLSLKLFSKIKGPDNPTSPRLPRKTKVRLCHACHAKWRGVTGVTGDQASPSAPPSAMSAMPATRNDGGCEIAPRLPRETTVDVRLCHACHAKCRGVKLLYVKFVCAVVPRLPRKVPRRKVIVC